MPLVVTNLRFSPLRSIHLICERSGGLGYRRHVRQYYRRQVEPRTRDIECGLGDREGCVSARRDERDSDQIGSMVSRWYQKARPIGASNLAVLLRSLRCGNAQNILGSIDQQIDKAKSDAAQIRSSNQYHIDQRDAAYTAKLNSIQGGGTRNRGGPLPPTSLMRRADTPVESTSTSPRSAFGTMGDDDEPTSMSKGRKSVSDSFALPCPPLGSIVYPR